MIYTAAAHGGGGQCAWAYVIVAHSPEGVRERVAEAAGTIENTTEPAAKLRAAEEGLQRTPVGVAVQVVSNHQYLIDGACKHMDGWKEAGWRRPKGKKLANVDTWKRIYSLNSAREVEWVLQGELLDPSDATRAEGLAYQKLDAIRW